MHLSACAVLRRAPRRHPPSLLWPGAPQHRGIPPKAEVAAETHDPRADQRGSRSAASAPPGCARGGRQGAPAGRDARRVSGSAPGLGVRRQLSETGTGGRGRLGIRSPGLLFLSWGPRASRFLPLCLSFLLESAKCEMGPGSGTSARLGSALLRVGVQLLWESRLPWST